LLQAVAPSDIGLEMELFAGRAVVKYVLKLMTLDLIAQPMPTWVQRGGGDCIGIWSVIDLQTSKKLGPGVLLPMPIVEDNTNRYDVVENEMPDANVEVGYILKPSVWRQGYASKICRCQLRFAF
jgi:hypothetical protein